MVEEKICILAYDALEIELVEKFDFPNLKQVEYSKTDISEFEKISTDILWGSFLAGENLEPEYTKKSGSNFLRNILRKPHWFIRNHFSVKMGDWLQGLLEDTGILQEIRGEVYSRNVVGDLHKKTIFDLTDDSVGVNIPSFNRDPEHGPDFDLGNKLNHEVSDDEFWKGVWNGFEKTKNELLSELDRDLVMAWFRPADWLGHIWRSDMEKMEETYRILDEFAEEVKDKFDGQVFIIADHGMRRVGDFGDHSNLNYGYYSSNRKLGLKNPKLTDFYEIIKEILAGEFDSKMYSGAKLEEQPKEEEIEGDEKEEIKKRLKKLGYFD